MTLGGFLSTNILLCFVGSAKPNMQLERRNWVDATKCRAADVLFSFCTSQTFSNDLKMAMTSEGMGRSFKRGSAQHCGHHQHRRQREDTRRYEHTNCLSTTSTSSPWRAGTRHGSGCRCGRACRRGCCPSL